MTYLSDLRKLTKIAIELGYEVDVFDYGFTRAAHTKDGKHGIWLGQVFRAERDGATGSILTTEKEFREWHERTKS